MIGRPRARSVITSDACNAEEIYVTLFLDTETTGLGRLDDLVEIAIVDRDAKEIFNSLLKPKAAISRPASAVHGITSDMVAESPSLESVVSEIRTLILHDPHVVIYNSSFDMRFFPDGFWHGIRVDCAMRRFASYCGRTVKLSDAAHTAGHQWSGASHRALADAQACRTVWLWLDHHDSRARPSVQSRTASDPKLYMDGSSVNTEQFYRKIEQKKTLHGALWKMTLDGAPAELLRSYAYAEGAKYGFTDQEVREIAIALTKEVLDWKNAISNLQKTVI